MGGRKSLGGMPRRMQTQGHFRVSIFLSSNKLPLNLGGERGILIQVKFQPLISG